MRHRGFTRQPVQAALLTFVALAGAGACVEARDPPPLIPQVRVPYGDRIYLADHTQGVTIPYCKRFAMPMPAGTRTGSAAATDDLRGSNGSLVVIRQVELHNCYIKLEPTIDAPERQLRTDVLEITNELFQLCVDSGACAAPDPSNADKNENCSSEEGFDKCPVVAVPQAEAEKVCRFFGRRLPTQLEHAIIRQAGVENRLDPTKMPIYPTGGTSEKNDAPGSCDQAVLKAGGCAKPVAVDPTPDAPVGAAMSDAVGVEGTDQQQVLFDLMGNVAEWAKDVLPATPAGSTRRPWFCDQELKFNLATKEVPRCPDGANCAYGQAAYATNDPVRTGFQPDWPVCTLHEDLVSSTGVEGAAFGGSYEDGTVDRKTAGIFARRVEADTANPSRSAGVRCVGDLDIDDRVRAAP